MVYVLLKETDGITDLFVNDKLICKDCKSEYSKGFIQALEFLGVYYEVNKLDEHDNFKEEKLFGKTS